MKAKPTRSLLERLRDGPYVQCGRSTRATMDEAAAEIERLQRELADAQGLASAAMRSAFPEIASAHPVPEGAYSSDHRQ